MLGSILTTQAQQRQNDATWQETVDFIEKNMKYLENSKLYETIDVILTDYFIIIQYEQHNLNKDLYCEGIYKIPVNMLDQIYVFESIVHFKTTEKNIQLKYKNCRGYPWIDNNGKKEFKKVAYLKFATKDLATRIGKAFKHYVYLANEKRKKSKF